MGTASFIWFYQYPLVANMPMHVAVVKTFLDILSNPNQVDYPYVMNMRVSSYEFAQFIIAFFVKLFGLATGAKLALSLYLILFPISVYFLVGRFNPESTWSRLIGFPLTLNYFFHWGFWPFLLGMTMAIFAIGLSINRSNNKSSTLINMITRLFTLLLYPTAVLAVGLYDIIIILLNIQENRNWYNPVVWKWKQMFIIWFPSICFTILMYFLSVRETGGAFQWGTLTEQLIQLVRPFYLTTRWYESILPLLLGFYITVRLFLYTLKSRVNFDYFIAGAFIILCGLVFPRDDFFGSWEHGSRLIIIGTIIVFSLWSAVENKFSKYIFIWIIFTFVINLSVSHYLWNLHDKSYKKALSVLQNNFTGAKMRINIINTYNGPSIPLGEHVASWAWCEEYIFDTYNAVASLNNFGPVKYIGINKNIADNKGIISGVIKYHPYKHFSPDEYVKKEIFMIDDKIYTIIAE